jgi:hypothetical protein
MDQQGGATDGPAPIVELAAITVHCLDLRPMIDFYAQAFGARTSHENDTGAWIRLDQGPLILLRRVDGYQAPTWPQQDVPIQFHLELWIDDLEGAESRLQALGAATPRPDRESGRHGHTATPAATPAASLIVTERTDSASVTATGAPSPTCPRARCAVSVDGDR